MIWQYHRISSDLLKSIFECQNNKFDEDFEYDSDDEEYYTKKNGPDYDCLVMLGKLLENMVKTICEMVIKEDTEIEEWIV